MTANTITALRKTQWGFEGVAAQGTLTLAVQPTATDTMTIGDIVYTWVASGASTAGQINVGANVAAAKVNVLAAIGGTDGWNIANPAASASAFSGDVTTLTAKAKGTAGNSIVTTETYTSASNIFNGATLGTTTAGAGGHGTAVAATSIAALEDLEWGDDAEVLYNPMFATSILARRRGAGTPVQHGARFSFSDQPVVWEQLPHWLSMAVKGGVTPQYTSSIYRWTHTRTPTAHPNLDSVTFERYFSNGEGGAIEQRCAYAMLSKWSLKFAVNDTLKMSGDGFGRAFETNTITAALSLPTPVLGVSALAKVYLDTSWGGIGNTLLSEQVVGFELEHGTGCYPLDTAEGRSGLDFTKHMYNAEETTLMFKLTCLVDPTTYAAENVAAAAGTVRAVQVYVSDGSTRVLKLNMLLRHVKPFYTKIGTQDGQDIVEYELEEAPDTTNFFAAILDHPSVAVKT